jgi:hypothetical protein
MALGGVLFGAGHLAGGRPQAEQSRMEEVATVREGGSWRLADVPPRSRPRRSQVNIGPSALTASPAQGVEPNFAYLAAGPLDGLAGDRYDLLVITGTADLAGCRFPARRCCSGAWPAP